MTWVTKIFVVILCLGIMLPLEGVCQSYSNKKIVQVDGVNGFWFDEETGTRMLKDLAEYKRLKEVIIPSFESQIKLKDLEIEQYKLNVEITEEIGEKWKGSFEDSEKLRMSETAYLRKQLDKKNAWYLRPGTIFVFGFVVGAVAMVGLSFGLNEALK